MFVDRADAGRRLAERLRGLADKDPVVLGLPRGGVPVAFEVARSLSAPLDVIVVRKLGVPFQPEFAMGAIGEGGVRVLDRDVLLAAGIGEAELAGVERRERAELERRVRQYRATRPPVPLQGRPAIVVDDGIATGSTVRAACKVARVLGAARVIVAAPVASPSAVIQLDDVADEVICLAFPDPFYAVGEGYDDFTATSDAEVVALLERAAAGSQAPTESADTADPPIRDEDVEVAVGRLRLAGHLTVPESPRGLVVFVHGSGSSRHSPRNRFVASTLNDAGLGTLLIDLLTPHEELDRANVFDTRLLADRLGAVTAWLSEQAEAQGVRIGYFGASTGAAAALWAAAQREGAVGAVVSRGGRPDLAAGVLERVRAPTLLIVGGHDEIVLEYNREAQTKLRCENRLVVVPGATHLFEEPGALEAVAGLARDWLVHHLSPPARPGD
jgi:putative phosphoribosyl transferase